MMNNKKFCFYLMKSSAETYAMLQKAYGQFVLLYSRPRRWFMMFKEERQSISKEGGAEASVTALTEVNIITTAFIVRRPSNDIMSMRNIADIDATHILVTEILNMSKVYIQ